MFLQRLLTAFVLTFISLTFVSPNCRVNAKVDISSHHIYRISPDGTLVADFCSANKNQKQLIVYDSNGHICYSADSVYSVISFSPNSDQLLFVESNQQSPKYGQSQCKWAIKVWNKESQSLTDIPVENLNAFSTHFLGNNEITYLENIGNFSFTNFAKIKLASKTSELMPSKLSQQIFIKPIQDSSSTRSVKVSLDIQKGWLGKIGGSMLCTASNGKYLAIRCLSAKTTDDYKTDMTSLALFNSLGQPISTIMNLDGVLFPLWLSADGKKVITSSHSYEHSKVQTNNSNITTEKNIGDILTEWEWSTGKVRWTRNDIRFCNGGSETFGDFSLCNDRIAILINKTNIEQSKQQYIEIINEDTGKTERTFALNCNDVQSIRLTATNTIVIIHRNGQRQICYIDSGEIK